MAKVTVNIELDVAVALERLAQRRGESLTQIVNRVLRDYLHRQAQEPQPPSPSSTSLSAS
jgi:predicted transcriptional regulator